MRLIAITIVALLLSGCLTEDPLNKPFTDFEPVEIGDDLVITGPSAEGMDSMKLVSAYKKAWSDPDLWSLRSMLIFRNNHLVAEAYLKDDRNATTPELIWSTTKQILAVITGIAVDRGIISVNDPISEYFPEEITDHPEKAGITVEQMLTMYSGIGYTNDGLGGDTDKLLRGIPDNMVEYILSIPMQDDPGTVFNYKDGDPHLVSAVIQRATGMPLDAWADEVFFSQIGVTNYSWVRYKDGVTNGGYGIEITPRELAKIAMCVADSGMYNDRRIVSAEWIREMTSVKTDTDLRFKFGYYWWIDTTRNIHFTWGHGGQYAFIIPSRSLVLVMTSIPNTQGDYQVDADELMPLIDEIISACD